MSLKENIDMVKEELSQEEKFFASAVKTERFVKKYKTPLLSVFIAIFIVIVANSLYQANKTEAIESSNEAYMKLLANADDSEAKKILKENNEALYDAWQLKLALEQKSEVSLAGLTSSKSEVIADLARYELAALKKDKAALSEYAFNQEAIYQDLAIMDEAVLLMQEGKTKEAKARLSLIGDKSALKKLSMLLQHYGVQ